MPVNGVEYFFSNILLRAYQVPMMFSESSEFEE